MANLNEQQIIELIKKGKIHRRRTLLRGAAGFRRTARGISADVARCNVCAS